MKILGIETSCDETGIALIQDGKLIINDVYTQEIHSQFGGVVPEIASREHMVKLPVLLEYAVKETELNLNEISALAVTYGPGLLCCLLMGINFTKGLSYSLNIPIIPVNHLEAHIYSPFINSDEPTYPFISLLVSGGHTQLIKVNNFRDYEVLGNTLDDACGEAFDKISKLLGLGYPGGPEIESWAKKGDDTYFNFTVPDPPDLNFSYSGLKTQVLYTYRDLSIEERITRIPDIAASFQRTAIEELIIKLKRTIEKTGINRVSISGGVSANLQLRKKLQELNIEWFAPLKEFTGDNAAMVAYTGYKMFKAGIKSNLKLQAEPRLTMVSGLDI